MDLRDPGDPDRPQLVLDLATGLTDLGELDDAERLLSALVTEAGASGDERMKARASIQLWEIRSSSENKAGWKRRAARDVCR